MGAVGQASREAIIIPRARGAGDGWDALLVCLSGFLLTSVGRIHQLFPVIAPLKPALVTGALAGLLYVLDPSPRRRLAGLRTPATWYLLALAGWMALTVPVALWPSGALDTWLDFAKTVLIYVVIVGAARTVRDVERLALVYFVAAVIFAAIVLTRFDVGDEGRLAKLYYYDANDFATFAVTALPLGLYFAVSHRIGPVRLLSWCGIGALVVAFAWSGSRGGFLALLAVAGYVLLRSSTIARRWRVVAVLAIALLTVATGSESYWRALQTIVRPSGDYNLTSEEGRLQIWDRGMGYVRLHPVLGVGAGNFATAEGTISPLSERGRRGFGLKWGPPHNSYLQVAAELGVPGLLLFVGFLASVFASLRRARAPAGRPATPVDANRLAQSLTAALIGFAAGAFFLTLGYYDMLYTLAALAVALRKVQVRAAAPSGAALVTRAALPFPLRRAW